MFKITYYVPTFIKVGKKKVYVNAQNFYKGINHFTRSKIKNDIKTYIHKQLLEQDIHKYSKLRDKTKLTFEYTIYTCKTRFDLDNISYIIIKMTNDTLVDIKLIPDDNINIIQEYNIKGIIDNSIDKDYFKIELVVR